MGSIAWECISEVRGQVIAMVAQVNHDRHMHKSHR